MIEGVDFTGSGAVGGGVLFAMTVLAVGNVESSFNDIWGVASGRSWARRFSDYLAVIIIAPLLGGVALSWVATIDSQWAASALSDVAVLGLLHDFGGALVPIVMLWVAFAFLYWFLPNTRVRLLSALIGGAFAGVTVAMAQVIYVDFSVGAARADRFFGGFALLPLLFAWIYVFWSIVLLGAEIAFAHQNFTLYRQEVRGDPAGPAEREAIGLRIAVEVARCFHAGGAAPNAARLADDLRIPVRTVRSVVERLQQVEILTLRLDGENEEAYQLGRPSDTIRVAHVLDALRGHRGTPAGTDRARNQVMALLAEIDHASQEVSMSMTLADLVTRSAAEARVDPQEAPL
jgi:membrane protein